MKDRMHTGTLRECGCMGQRQHLHAPHNKQLAPSAFAMQWRLPLGETLRAYADEPPSPHNPEHPNPRNPGFLHVFFVYLIIWNWCGCKCCEEHVDRKTVIQNIKKNRKYAKNLIRALSVWMCWTSGFLTIEQLKMESAKGFLIIWYVVCCVCFKVLGVLWLQVF